MSMGNWMIYRERGCVQGMGACKMQWEGVCGSGEGGGGGGDGGGRI